MPGVPLPLNVARSPAPPAPCRCRSCRPAGQASTSDPPRRNSSHAAARVADHDLRRVVLQRERTRWRPPRPHRGDDHLRASRQARARSDPAAAWFRRRWCPPTCTASHGAPSAADIRQVQRRVAETVGSSPPAAALRCARRRVGRRWRAGPATGHDVFGCVAEEELAQRRGAPPVEIFPAAAGLVAHTLPGAGRAGRGGGQVDEFKTISRVDHRIGHGFVHRHAGDLATAPDSANRCAGRSVWCRHRCRPRSARGRPASAGCREPGALLWASSSTRTSLAGAPAPPPGHLR